jgi:hypothetical protein
MQQRIRSNLTPSVVSARRLSTPLAGDPDRPTAELLRMVL